MSAVVELHRRLADADAVLITVRRLERMQRTARRATPAETISIAAIRASAYVMLYNAVESAVRAVFENLRTAIQDEGVAFANASDFWRLDYIQATFLDRMQSGTNHGNLLVEIVPTVGDHLKWSKDKIGEMPWSGNFGQSAAMMLRRKLPLDWSAPDRCAGGADLEVIRARRNDLAHGFESFDNVGNATTTLDLFRVVDHTRIFMTSWVGAIERYQAARAYVR